MAQEQEEEQEELHSGQHSGSGGCDPETECCAMMLCCHGVTVIACEICHAQTSFILSNELISRNPDFYLV